MDLIYRVSLASCIAEKQECEQKLMAVSCRNIVVFTSQCLLNEEKSYEKHHVYAYDIEQPWEVFTVTSMAEAISHIVWDSNGYRLMIADMTGSCQIWTMENYLINVWKCIGKVSIAKEHIVALKWLHLGGQVTYDVDKKDNIYYSEKFTRTKFSASLTQFGGTAKDGWIALTSSGLVCVGLFTIKSKEIELFTHCLQTNRSFLKVADIAYVSSGDLIIVCNSGRPSDVIQFFRITLNFEHNCCIIKSNFHMSCFTKSCVDAVEEDFIKFVKFLNKEDPSIIVIGINKEDNSILESWCTQNSDTMLNRMIQPEPQSVNLQKWVHKASIVHTSHITSIALPKLAVSKASHDSKCMVLPQTITVVYKDGCVKVINAFNFQLVSSQELEGSHMTFDGSSGVKRQKTVCPIVAVEQTAMTCCVVCLDTADTMHLYKIYNTHDEVTQVPVTHILSLIEYAITLGIDWWDIVVTLRQGLMESVIQRLSDQYAKQPMHIHERLYARFLAVKASLYKCSTGGSQKAEDCQAKLMLSSVATAFRSMLRPQSLSSQEKSPAERLKLLCVSNTDTDLDQLLTKLEAKDFSVETGILLSLQRLIQWAADFVLYLLASLPMYKYYSSFPGMCIIQDPSSLATLRQILIVVRVWGVVNASCLPVFATSSNLDCLPHLFKLLTKVWLTSKDGTNADFDDSILDECCLLPSQFMIPNMDMFVRPSVVPTAMLAMQQNQITFEYGVLPDHLTKARNSSTQPYLIDIPVVMLPHKKRDVLRQIHLGASPAEDVRCCCRCGNLSLLHGPSKLPVLLAWDQRWVKSCLCGGQWKLLKTSVES